MLAMGQDLRFAFRQLAKAPGFTVIAVLTLALGIGATTALFSLVEGILLRPLPFANPARLVVLGDHIGDSPSTSVTAREIGTYSKATNAFFSVGGYITAEFELSSGAVPEEVDAARLTSDVFPTLGVRPTIGRFFTREEEVGHEPVAVISYRLWSARYHRDPHVLGRSIALDRKVYSIVGVMPRGFEFPLAAGELDQAQLWVPMSLTADELSEGHAGFWGYHMVARLKDGVTIAEAAQDADRVARQSMQKFPPSISAIHIRGDVTPLEEYDVEDVRPLLRVLFLAVSVVLLIACANVAGLMLVRAIRRRHEYAVRLALGARPSAVMRESLFEGMLLGFSAGFLGLALAALVLRAALHLLPDSIPRIDSIAIDAFVAGFALVVALASGALCSLAPAFAALRTNLKKTLAEGDRTGHVSTSHTWLRSSLVVTEVAIALVLLTAAGALLRSLEKMRAVDPGFRPDHVLMAGYTLPLYQYPDQASVDRFARQVVDRLSNQPGVIAVGTTSAVPAGSIFAKSAYTIEGEPTDTWKVRFAVFATTYGQYFRTMSISLLDGRYFTEDDRASAPPVIIVNQSMAKHCWPGQRAIGKRMHVGSPQKGLPWATVVGVVGDTKMGARDQSSEDQWYTPAEQPATLYGSENSGKLTDAATGYIILRSPLPPERMIQTLRSSVAEIDRLLALEQVETMNDAIADVEAPRRFNTDLITAFAAGAVLLSLIGIYAVIAFSVSLRTHEIAVRMALGAQRGGIARLVLIAGVKLALAGCGFGVLGSLTVSRLLRSFLFEVSATDPAIYATGVLLMLLIGTLASVAPATRAAFAEPMTALRSG